MLGENPQAAIMKSTPLSQDGNIAANTTTDISRGSSLHREHKKTVLMRAVGDRVEVLAGSFGAGAGQESVEAVLIPRG